MKHQCISLFIAVATLPTKNSVCIVATVYHSGEHARKHSKVLQCVDKMVND